MLEVLIKMNLNRVHIRLIME